MKLKLHFLIYILFISLSTYAQETTVNLSMGTGYTNQVYYKLHTETQTSFIANSWDIAFLRTSAFNQGLVVNDGAGIQVFEAATTATDWDTINIANEASWTQLYNSDTERSQGAFMHGSASYGWGEYNVATHKVEGTTIFVLKYTDGTYKKFICEQYAAAYSIKYASWDGTVWSEDKTTVISNTNNENNNYNYYSLQNEEEVIAAPATTDWDLVFRKYYTDLGGGTMYSVTGVLHGDTVEVAAVTSETDTTDLTYTTDINTIGYDWKSLNSTTFTFDVDATKHYYVKDSNENIYKLYFTEFGGSSTGDVQFKFEDVTTTLGVEDLGESVSFAIYPNPISQNKKMNVIFEINASTNDTSAIEIYSLTGKKVYQTNLTNTQGFYAKELNLNALNSGVYLLKFTSGKISKTKKIIVQ